MNVTLTYAAVDSPTQLTPSTNSTSAHPTKTTTCPASWGNELRSCSSSTGTATNTSSRHSNVLACCPTTRSSVTPPPSTPPCGHETMPATMQSNPLSSTPAQRNLPSPSSRLGTASTPAAINTSSTPLRSAPPTNRSMRRGGSALNVVSVKSNSKANHQLRARAAE